MHVGGAKFQGRTVVPLQSKDNGYLSKASFRGLSLSPGELCSCCEKDRAREIKKGTVRESEETVAQFKFKTHTHIHQSAVCMQPSW